MYEEKKLILVHADDHVLKLTKSSSVLHLPASFMVLPKCEGVILGHLLAATNGHLKGDIDPSIGTVQDVQ